jgi:hypothetical protein
MAAHPDRLRRCDPPDLGQSIGRVGPWHHRLQADRFQRLQHGVVHPAQDPGALSLLTRSNAQTHRDPGSDRDCGHPHRCRCHRGRQPHGVPIVCDQWDAVAADLPVVQKQHGLLHQHAVAADADAGQHASSTSRTSPSALALTQRQWRWRPVGSRTGRAADGAAQDQDQIQPETRDGGVCDGSPTAGSRPSSAAPTSVCTG